MTGVSGQFEQPRPSPPSFRRASSRDLPSFLPTPPVLARTRSTRSLRHRQSLEQLRRFTSVVAKAKSGASRRACLMCNVGVDSINATAIIDSRLSVITGRQALPAAYTMALGEPATSTSSTQSEDRVERYLGGANGKRDRQVLRSSPLVANSNSSILTTAVDIEPETEAPDKAALGGGL